jgi:thioredoxin-like negative regulator of GroEL
MMITQYLKRNAARIGAALCLTLVIVSAWVGSAAAEEVNWRSNYNSARKEAQDKNRPLILDFGTENCVWCDKLDASTFKDPAVVALMNEQFIPLKIDAQKNPQLVEALSIQSYPTLVLAAPDGKILDTIEGFRDAAKFQEHLQKALGAAAGPDWMARDYQEATKAINAADFARAIALLKNLIDDGKDRPVQVKAKQLLQDLELQATGRLTQAKQLNEKGQTAEALDLLRELLLSFAGTKAATEGGQMVSTIAAKPEVKVEQRTRRARELLTQAREDYRNQQYLCCMDRCEILAGTYADLPEGAEAIQLANEIKNNPEWMREACDNLSERLGVLYLALAETWLKKGQPQQAILCLERIIQTFPGSRQADAAQTRLAQIQGKPIQSTDLKKTDDKK